ncbi:NAD(P)-dependent oxidoreductase [Variovorax sp. J22R115]|uniref:NAD(P)-dependent oxidoreductase n=1 Tax=Variovorax sp. J22R115 TaxID=3053509 RepID=UPI00257764CB|nr:NAD(P)-dependent oxidoreductase [Variovorax sp. J22R115]MDM0052867.1 NAD(P)-dependent oxidoreductase [Variovorax sp. J22R115]
MKVVFLDAATLPQALAFDDGLGIDYHPYDTTSPAEVGERIAGATVVITNKIRLDGGPLRAARGLRLVAVAAAGTDNIDVEAAEALGIRVQNVPDYGSESVAEHAIATLFALRREIVTYAAAARDGRWTASRHFCWTGPRIRDLGGSRFGIVGRGRIGEAAARLARGVGMTVHFAQTPGTACEDDELPLDDILSQSDAITLHVPLTPGTKGLINAESLARMKPDAVLINTGRGALVDPAALADALRSGSIAGAAIDVLEVEPPASGHPLIDGNVPHLLLTPHVAWASDSAQARLATRLQELVTQQARLSSTRHPPETNP